MAQLLASLHHSLLAQRAAYRREILLYVADWQAELASVRSPFRSGRGAKMMDAPGNGARFGRCVGFRTGVLMQPGPRHPLRSSADLEQSAAGK